MGELTRQSGRIEGFYSTPEVEEDSFSTILGALQMLQIPDVRGVWSHTYSGYGFWEWEKPWIG